MKDYWNLAWGPSPYGGTSTQSALRFQPLQYVQPYQSDLYKEQKKMDKQTVEQVVEDLVTVASAKAAIATIVSTLDGNQKSEIRDWFENESFNW